MKESTEAHKQGGFTNRKRKGKRRGKPSAQEQGIRLFLRNEDSSPISHQTNGSSDHASLPPLCKKQRFGNVERVYGFPKGADKQAYLDSADAGALQRLERGSVGLVFALPHRAVRLHFERKDVSGW